MKHCNWRVRERPSTWELFCHTNIFLLITFIFYLYLRIKIVSTVNNLDLNDHCIPLPQSEQLNPVSIPQLESSRQNGFVWKCRKADFSPKPCDEITWSSWHSTWYSWNSGVILLRENKTSTGTRKIDKWRNSGLPTFELGHKSWWSHFWVFLLPVMKLLKLTIKSLLLFSITI